MSKILSATCENNVVKVNGVTVDGPVILSQGKKSSTGVLILQGESAPVYVATNTTDIADLITSVTDLLDKVVTSLTALDAVTVSPGSATASITQITVGNTTLKTKKDLLK